MNQNTPELKQTPRTDAKREELMPLDSLQAYCEMARHADDLETDLALSEAGAAVLREALVGIAKANWREWCLEMAAPEQFVAWAKSRANHALKSTAGESFLARLMAAEKENFSMKCQIANQTRHCQEWSENWAKAEAERDTALAKVKELEAQSAWRPIESAPKDGTEVLGWHPEWVNAEFSPDGIRSCIHDGERWCSAHWVDDDFNILHMGDHIQPTHWQPLPPPPAAADSQGTEGKV